MKTGCQLTDDQYEEIKQEVVDLFVRYNVRRIPVNSFKLAKKLGIAVIPYSTLPAEKREAAEAASPDGCCLCNRGKGDTIYYKDEGSMGRQNMTVMHELAHLVLGHPQDMDQVEAEAEAAFFAKYALAPPPLVHMTQPEDYQDIQNTFEISKEAAYHAWDYYQKWLLQYRWDGDYYPYEQKLLRQVSVKRRRLR